MIRHLFAIARLFLFSSYLLFGLGLAIILSLILGKSWYTNTVGSWIKVIWTKGVAIILGLNIKRQGRSSGEPRLIVSNHISWLDIVAISAYQPCVFIAKSSVVNWPVIGFLASISGTLFLDRQKRKDLNNVMRKGKVAIDEGISLVFFPEATTTDGKQIKSFHPSIYQTAIDVHCSTQAIAISYPEKKDLASPAPYIDDDTFVSHLYRILKAPGVDVHLHYCTPIPTNCNNDRKKLAASTQNQVIEALSI